MAPDAGPSTTTAPAGVPQRGNVAGVPQRQQQQVPGAGKMYVSPQDLSPGPGASPARAERAFALQQLVNSGQATTDERVVGGGGMGGGAFANAGPATYAPDLGANVVTNEAGQRMVVGAPDPSVGALEGSAIEDLGGQHFKIRTPTGGSIEFKLSRYVRRLPCSASDL